jgi:hypothetical protein
MIAEEEEASTPAGKTELPRIKREFFTKYRLFILQPSSSYIAGLNRLSILGSALAFDSLLLTKRGNT